MFLKMVVCASAGVTMEVVFTALMDYPTKKNIRLEGYSYIWMLPIYALVPLFLDAFYPRLAGIPLPARLAIYVAMLMTMEYISGWMLRKTIGICPWEPGYRGKRWSIHDLVRLDFAPAWALACFIFERLYLAL